MNLKEENIYKAGQLILSLLTTLPPTSKDSIDWDKVEKKAKELVDLAQFCKDEKV